MSDLGNALGFQQVWPALPWTTLGGSNIDAVVERVVWGRANLENDFALYLRHDGDAERLVFRCVDEADEGLAKLRWSGEEVMTAFPR